MKIGILTFHRPINYGAFLQAYSLCIQLKKCIPGADVEIVDYIAPKENKTIYVNVLRTVKYYGVGAALKDLTKIKVFKHAVRDLPLSKQSFCKQSLTELYDYINKTYDLLIIGSDAVFNWNQNGYPTAFIPQYKYDIPVVTYAASVHGLRFLDDELKNQLNACGQVFEKMRLVGVRDFNTERFVTACNKKVEPMHCCDPTVILDLCELYKLQHRTLDEIREKYGIDSSKPYIVLMMEDQSIAADFYNKYSGEYSVISLFKKNKTSDAFLHDLTPVEWSMMICNASLVVTNFFHGTLLALKQNVPAIVVDMSKYDAPYEGKLYDLMCRRLALSELYIKQQSWQKSKKTMLSLADDCLKGMFSQRIEDGIIKEGKSFDDFTARLSKIIDTEEHH